MTSQALSVFGTTLSGGTAVCASLGGDTANGSYVTPLVVKIFPPPSLDLSIATLPKFAAAEPEMTCANTDFTDHGDGHESHQSNPGSDEDGEQNSNPSHGVPYWMAGAAFVGGVLGGGSVRTVITAGETIRLHNQVKKASLRKSIKKVQDTKAKNERRRVAEEEAASRKSALTGISATAGQPSIGE